MSLQRRLLVYLLVCAPLVWTLALLVSINRAQDDVNELFDAEMIRLARQVQATLRHGTVPVPDEARSPASEVGITDESALAVAAWNREGRLLVFDHEGLSLPYRTDATGFVDATLAGTPWRIYYLQSFTGEWLVAAAQRVDERDELVWNLTLSQIVPWLLMLPVLLVAMLVAVRHALAPLHRLATDIEARNADELAPIAGANTPRELAPLVAAMNRLFLRIETTLARERRFTADAAHELRTPLAVLRAQWDVLRRSADPTERAAAEAGLGAGFERMERLVTQMLALSRVESADGALARDDVRWPTVVEQAVSACLNLAERRRIEIACEWPTDGRPPLPLRGDEALVAVLLRNLLDNAVRYAPPGSQVVLRVDEQRVAVENDGELPCPDRRDRLGERFFRPDGQDASGSGLGLSIVQRIASLHGLVFTLTARADGAGVCASVRRVAPDRAAA